MIKCAFNYITKQKKSNTFGFNVLAHTGIQNLVNSFPKNKYHPLIWMPSASTEPQPQITIFLRSLLNGKFFFTNQNFFFPRDQVLKYPIQPQAEISLRGSVNRGGLEKEKESLLSKPTDKKFIHDLAETGS